MLDTQHNRVQIHEFIRGLTFHFASRFDLHTSDSLFALKCFTTIFRLLLQFCSFKQTPLDLSFSVFLLTTFHFQLEGWIFNFSQILSRGSPSTNAGNHITEIVWNW